MTNSTRWIVFAIAALAAALPAQDSGPKALARAQLLEQQEGDLAAAQVAYRALLDDQTAKAEHGEAALRLGALLWRLDQRDAAKPLLERAVAAGGVVGEQATAVLQGQDDAGKQAQERLEKARAVVGRLMDLEWQRVNAQQTAEAADAEILSSLQQQLRRLPGPAATALIELLGHLQGLAESQFRTGKGDPIPQRTLVALLWEIGGKPAGEYFARIADDPSVDLRRFVTGPLRTVRPAKDLEPALTRLARDADPTNEVWQNVAAGIGKLDFDAALRLLRESHPGPVAAGLRAASRKWPEMEAAQRDAVVKEHGARIVEATRSDDGRLADSAWDLLRVCGYAGPRSACALFLSVAPRYPGRPSQCFGGFVPDLDDAWLHELRVAADQIGRPATGSPPQGVSSRCWGLRNDGESAIAAWLTKGKPSWTAKGIDDALRLLDLDYGMFGNGGWLQPAFRTGSPEQMAEVIRRLGRSGGLDQVRDEVASLKPAAPLFAPLRDLVEACLDGDTIPWDGTQGSDRTVRGRRVNVTVPSDTVVNLFRAAANTRAPEAAVWFASIVDRHPEVVWLCCESLIQLSRNGVDGATAGLRKLLVWPGTETDEVQQHERSQVFAELARRGDVEAIHLFPRAYELGLTRASVGLSNANFTARGVGFLGDRPDYGPQSPRGAWHGYGEQDLVTAWHTLFESKAADDVWNELTGATGPSPSATQGPADFVIPVHVVPVLLTALQARWPRFAADSSARRAVESSLASCLSKIPAAAVTSDGAFARTLRDLFTKGDASLAATCFHYLPPDVARVFAPEARQLLRRTTMKQIVFQVQRAGVELTADDWRDLLRNPEPGGLVVALRALPPRSSAELRSDIEPALAHASTDVRIAACHAMQRLYGADAVANLLPLLKDNNDDVRKAARTSLDELREEYERGSFWAQAKSGIDTTPASAAAKLLAQGKAGEAKEQRLLAMRSLAVLGAPEALPYLIDWTKDADAEIAQAAHNAILRIHAKAGADAKKPESK